MLLLNNSIFSLCKKTFYSLKHISRLDVYITHVDGNVFSATKKKLQQLEIVMFRSILYGSYAINGVSPEITPRAIQINIIFVVYFCNKRHQY